MRAEIRLLEGDTTVEAEGTTPWVRMGHDDALKRAMTNMVKGLSRRHLIMLYDAIHGELLDRDGERQ